MTADAFGLEAAMWLIAALTFVSGAVSAVRMGETLPVSAHAVPNVGTERRVTPPTSMRVPTGAARGNTP